jgi:hypothetical protein
MLTTVDNPFNPSTQFDEWYAYDLRMGYGTMELLARIVRTSHDLSEADQDDAIEKAIDEVCEYNVNGMFRKVAIDSA